MWIWRGHNSARNSNPAKKWKEHGNGEEIKNGRDVLKKNSENCVNLDKGNSYIALEKYSVKLTLPCWND